MKHFVFLVSSFGVLAAVLLPCVAHAQSPPPASGLLQLLRRAIDADPKKQEAEARAAAIRVATIHPMPATWDSALYLPYAVPNDLLSRLVGTQVAYDFKEHRAVTLEITKAEIVGDWIQAKVSLGLRIGTSIW